MYNDKVFDNKVRDRWTVWGHIYM